MRRVLEVGHGGVPLGNPLNSELRMFAARMPQDACYHGVDNPFLPEDWMQQTGQLIKNQEIAALEAKLAAEPHPRIALSRMDGRRLAFPDSSFEEAHLHNYVTDPRVSVGDVRKVISELWRVLAAQGVLLLSGESGASLEGKWFETALALQDSGFRTLNHAPVKALTVFPEDIELNHSYQNGIFLVMGK